MRDDIKWEDNETAIRELWPTAMYPPTLKALIKQQLSKLNQQWLREALDDVKCGFASHQPELKWWLQAYEKIEQRWFKTQPAKRCADVIIVDHTRVRNEQTYEVSSLFFSLDEAVAFARNCGGSIRGRRHVVSDDQLRAEIKALPREQVSAAFEWLRKRAWITKEKVTSDIDKWSPMLLGTISGVIDVTSKGLTQPSALPPAKENA
jgi:hypothetical protein